MLYIGCSGWSYSGWKGHFYPKHMENKNYLSYYSKYFNFVEIDSTYYKIPSRYVVRAWKDKTPSDFRFTLKFPKMITHERKLEDVSKHLSILFYSLEPIIDKTIMLLIQLPPHFTEKKGFNSLKNMASKLDRRFKYAIEFRDSSWFNNHVYDLLRENNISFVWSVRDELNTPTIVTSDQIYIRFIGDRSILEKKFGRIVKDRTKEMTEFAKHIREIQNNKTIHDIIIAFNNHFAGFGPQSVNDFLKILNEPQIIWNNDIKNYDNNNSSTHLRNNSQTSLSDY